MNTIPKKQVAVSFLGTVLDKGFGQGRWLKWRPNVAMNQRQDFHLDRMELFYAEKYRELADHVKADIQQVSPHTVVNLVPMELAKPVGFLRGLYQTARLGSKLSI